jgi:hypothetical protein
VALVDGFEPSVVYEVLLTPDPPVSLADNVTVTAFTFQAVEHVELLHEMVVVGAAVSVGTVTDICWDCGTSWLPALSTEAKLTVVVCETVNDPEYVTAEALLDGSEPSVVYLVVLTPDPPASLADSATVTALV